MQNIRTIRYCFILFLSVLVSCKGQTDKLNDNCPLIPKPLSVDMQPGEFTFGDSVVIELKTDDEEIKRAANFLKTFVEQTGSCKAQIPVKKPGIKSFLPFAIRSLMMRLIDSMCPLVQ